MAQRMLLSTGEVARRLGVARHQLSYCFHTNKLPEPRRVCGRRAFTETDLHSIRNFFEQRRAAR
jgi:DNA-binding transcriptional MerR regulator